MSPSETQDFLEHFVPRLQSILPEGRDPRLYQLLSEMPFSAETFRCFENRYHYLVTCHNGALANIVRNSEVVDTLNQLAREYVVMYNQANSVLDVLEQRETPPVVAMRSIPSSSGERLTRVNGAAATS